MRNILLPTLPPGLVAGTPVRASAPVGVSPEVAKHHLAVHPCPKTGHYSMSYYVCDCGATSRVVVCVVCDKPIAVIADDPMCEHLPDLIRDLNLEAAL